MNIRISIYDFFANTIPGSVYLFIIVYIFSQFGVIQFSLTTFDPSLSQIILIAGIAYIVGLIFGSLARAWYGLFRPNNFPEKVLKGFQERRPHVDIKFHATDWAILLAYIRQENPDIAERIDRDNASNLMLRSLSLAFFIFAIEQAIQFFLSPILTLHLVLSILFVISSIIMGRLSVRFASWFYLQIYEATIARVLPGLDKATMKDEKTVKRQTKK